MDATAAAANRLATARQLLIARRAYVLRESWSDLKDALRYGAPLLAVHAVKWMLKAGVGYSVFLWTAPMQAQIRIWREDMASRRLVRSAHEVNSDD